jgi:RNase P subunit RPR2
MTKKQEDLTESTCNACGEIRRYLDEKGICLLCKRPPSGKEIRQDNEYYENKRVINTFSKTGDPDENAYLR